MLTAAKVMSLLAPGEIDVEFSKILQLNLDTCM
jgi:hypothetical protein